MKAAPSLKRLLRLKFGCVAGPVSVQADVWIGWSVEGSRKHGNLFCGKMATEKRKSCPFSRPSNELAALELASVSTPSSNAPNTRLSCVKTYSPPKWMSCLPCVYPKLWLTFHTF